MKSPMVFQLFVVFLSVPLLDYSFASWRTIVFEELSKSPTLLYSEYEPGSLFMELIIEF